MENSSDPKYDPRLPVKVIDCSYTEILEPEIIFDVAHGTCYCNLYNRSWTQ